MIIDIKFPLKIDGHQKQENVWNSRARFIDIMAGRRGGKDWITARKFIKRIYHDHKLGRGYKTPSIKKMVPRLHYWCIAPNYKLNAVQKKEIFKFVPDKLIQKHDNSKSQLWLYPEILIEFKSGEHPETLVSEGLNGIYITETARLKPTVWNDNLRPTLSDKQGWGLFTTTPMGHNWYMDDIRSLSDPTKDTHDSEWEAHYWKTMENVKCPGLVAEVEKARKTMPEKFFLRNYEANPDAYQGQVFEDFREDIHWVPFEFNRDRYKYVLAGLDWGWTHKGVLVVFGIDHDDNVDILDCVSKSGVNVISEDKSQITWRSICRDYAEKYGITWIFAGVDQPDNISMLKRSGINIRGAKNAVIPGIDFVSTLMKVQPDGKTKFRIRKGENNGEATRPLVRGIQGYKWPEKMAVKENPIKEKDDECDGMRYGLYSAYRLRYFGIDLMSTNYDELEDEAA